MSGPPPAVSRPSSEASASVPTLERLTSSLAMHMPTSRVGRMLLQRLRRSASSVGLSGSEGVSEAEVTVRPSLSNPPPDTPGGPWPSPDRAFPSSGPTPAQPPPPGGQRLIVVANRLPVSAYRDGRGDWCLQESAGGLVSALMGVRGFETQWVGWPGVYAQGGERAALSATLASRGHTGVYLDGALMDLHYNGFCNSVLWPLFHYVPLAIDSKLSDTRAFGAQWNAYQLANRAFADAVLEEYTPGAMVWVQDYHLMLLPSLLKERVPGMKVGFFLHTPFPSSEIYRTLPVREELLRALLRSDLIGFHTYDYARHFVSACTRLLGLDATPSGVEDNGCLTRVAAFPIGIDPDRFTSALGSAEVRANVAQLLNRYAGRKVMLGVDRLDMVKGIPPKLLAFEKFLEEHPEWRDRVLLVQIAVPSRTDVPDYQRLRSVVHEVVGRINGAYGTLTHVPIYHLDRQLSFPELVALYAVTDVALVTSLRDGMNLVSYEYVACQRDNAGVLVLSEFAGAAQSLGAGALLVNPWNVSDVARAIHVALEMDEAPRRMRHQQNYLHVAQHTAQTWAELFISELDDTHVEAVLRTRAVPPPLPAAQAVRAFSAARRRLLVLGYNATLTQAVPHISLGGAPKDHYDERRALTRVHPQALGALRALASDPSVLVLLVSGCTQALLEAAVGEARDAPRLWVAAENGVSVRDPGTGEWVPALELGDSAWMGAVQLVFEYFCERTPRSFVESRETSIVWNWKYADPEFGRLQARDLLQHLLAGPISNAYVDIVRGSKSIEVRPVGISKGLCVEKILHYIAETEPLDDVDFVFAAGHFYARDESVFTMLLGAGNAPPVSPRQALWAPQPVDDGGGPSEDGDADARAADADAQAADADARAADAQAAAADADASSQGEGEDGVAEAACAPPEDGSAAACALPAARPALLRASESASRMSDLSSMPSAPFPRPGSLASLPPTPGFGLDPAGAALLDPEQAMRGPPHPMVSHHELPFAVPARHTFTCTVGRSQPSKAQYSLADSVEVLGVLHQLARLVGASAEELGPLPVPASASQADLLSPDGGGW